MLDRGSLTERLNKQAQYMRIVKRRNARWAAHVTVRFLLRREGQAQKAAKAILDTSIFESFMRLYQVESRLFLYARKVALERLVKQEFGGVESSLRSNTSATIFGL